MKLLLLSLIGNVLAGTNEAGLKYLEAKDAEEGVVKLKSGLRYKVLRKGNGKWHPKVASPCKCHYSGELIDGKKIDSSYDTGEPITIAPNQGIKGWTEAMQLMVEGDKWEIYIPSDLGYGDNTSRLEMYDGIPGGSVLVFTMEMIEILGGDKRAVRCNVETGDDCDEKEKIVLEKYKGQDLAEWELALQRVKERERSRETEIVKADERKEVALEKYILSKLIKSKKPKKAQKGKPTDSKSKTEKPPEGEL